MPSTPSGSKGGDHRKGAVVLTPNGKSSAGNASPKGGGRDFTKLTSNVKSRSTQKEESENGYPGRNASREGWGEKKDSGWSRGKGKSFAKGQSKGKTKSASKASETASVGEANAAAPQLPRVRDEIQEEVDGIVSINSNLSRTDFDGRVFQYLHAIHGVGGQEKVRKALQTIHLSTLQKQRHAVKKWPAYLATLLKNFFDDLGAERKEERVRAKTEAEAYEKQLSPSVDAFFDKSVDKNVLGNPAANPQEAAAAAGDLRSTPQEWLQKAETEQQWLRQGSNLILSALSPEHVAREPGLPPAQLSLELMDISGVRSLLLAPELLPREPNIPLPPPGLELMEISKESPPPGLELGHMLWSCSEPSKNDIMLPNMIPETATECPSVGSLLHGTGQCKPCVWFHKPGGCVRGEQCRHCHTCPSNEVAQRKKQIVAALKAQAKGEAMVRKQQMMYLQASKMMSAASQLLPSHQTPKPLPLALLVA